jgi:hypothetical protein
MPWTKSIFFISLSLFSCKKPPVTPAEESGDLKKGILVLNEGLFQQNNASLSWINLENSEVNLEFFEQKSGRLLGDTGNDMKRYGDKVYIVVNASSTLEILNAKTGKPIKQILMQNGSVAKQPRSVTAYGSKVFITCYDGFVDVLDTNSLTITQRIQVGANPEESTVSNQKLYVTNSGGLNSPNVDSTVSIIDLNSFVEIKRLVVGKNPGSIITDDDGDVYVVSRGNYGSIPARMHKINTATDEVETDFEFDALHLDAIGSKFLISFHNYSTSTSNVALFNPQTDVLENSSFIDNSIIQTLYGIHYNASNQKIYCMDAMGFVNSGYVRVFSVTGSYETSFHVGLNPNSILFYD